MVYTQVDTYCSLYPHISRTKQTSNFWIYMKNKVCSNLARLSNSGCSKHCFKHCIESRGKYFLKKGSNPLALKDYSSFHYGWQSCHQFCVTKFCKFYPRFTFPVFWLPKRQNSTLLFFLWYSISYVILEQNILFDAR